MEISDKERELGVLSKWERKDDKQPPKAEPVSIEVWLYHPEIEKQIGEYCLISGRLYIVTKYGFEPYC